jgi:hypothetical protein
VSAKNQKLDRDALHRYLHDRCDAHGKVKVVQKLLAEQLDVTHYTISRILKEFVQEGRVKKLGKDAHNVSTYIVSDPETWSHYAGVEMKPKPRKIVWG